MCIENFAIIHDQFAIPRAYLGHVLLFDGGAIARGCDALSPQGAPPWRYASEVFHASQTTDGGWFASADARANMQPLVYLVCLYFACAFATFVTVRSRSRAAGLET
ncbi:hypothetical protein BV20DRAFT_541514 [Pilatotrama ljubarskyi]|nr:hypothetical protein BV20DRAFT_541514 [Pilatotrama ljubarskyi]